MHVLHVYRYCEPDRTGGIERHLSTLCRELAPAVRSTLLVSAAGSASGSEKVPWGEIVRVPRLGEWASVTINPTIPFYLRRFNGEIIHLHWAHPGAFLAQLLAGPRSKKLVVSYHMDVEKMPRLATLFAPFLRKVLEKAGAIVVGSQALIETSTPLEPFRGKCRVIPYGVDTSPRENGIASAAREIRNRYASPIILFVGRLVWYKGIDVLLEAMTGINATLLVVGEGPLRPLLEKGAASGGIGDRVIFLGRVESVSPYYEACDLLVLPSVSRTESFGLVLAEAMAFGKPVVSTELGTGTGHVNRHGETGYVVPPRDSGALAARINELLRDPALRDRMGRAGRERVARFFTKEQMARQFLELYTELASTDAIRGVSAQRHPCP